MGQASNTRRLSWRRAEASFVIPPTPPNADSTQSPKACISSARIKNAPCVSWRNTQKSKTARFWKTPTRTIKTFTSRRCARPRAESSPSWRLSPRRIPKRQRLSRSSLSTRRYRGVWKKAARSRNFDDFDVDRDTSGDCRKFTGRTRLDLKYSTRAVCAAGLRLTVRVIVIGRAMGINRYYGCEVDDGIS